MEFLIVIFLEKIIEKAIKKRLKTGKTSHHDKTMQLADRISD